MRTPFVIVFLRIMSDQYTYMMSCGMTALTNLLIMTVLMRIFFNELSPVVRLPSPRYDHYGNQEHREEELKSLFQRSFMSQQLSFHCPVYLEQVPQLMTSAYQWKTDASSQAAYQNAVMQFSI